MGLPVAGSTSKGPGSSSSWAISRMAGMTSAPMSRRLRMESSCVMAPSPSQKKMLPARLLGQLFGLIDVHLPEVTDVLGAGLVPLLGGGIVVQLKGLSRGLHLGGQHDIGDALPGGPEQGVTADHTRQPDGWMRFLVG